MKNIWQKCRFCKGRGLLEPWGCEVCQGTGVEIQFSFQFITTSVHWKGERSWRQCCGGEVPTIGMDGVAE